MIKMELKQNIPQVKVPRDITMVPIHIVDPRVLLMFKVPDIIKSTVYVNDNGKGKTEVWHSNHDQTWDCVIVTQ